MFLLDGFLIPSTIGQTDQIEGGAKFTIWEPFLGPGIVTNVITALGIP